MRRSQLAKNAPWTRRQGRPIIVERSMPGSGEQRLGEVPEPGFAGVRCGHGRPSSAAVGTRRSASASGPGSGARRRRRVGGGSSTSRRRGRRPSVRRGRGGPDGAAVPVPWFEGDLDGGRPGRDVDVGALPAVGEDDPAGGDELDELAATGVAVGVRPADRAAGAGVDLGGGGHPAHEVLGVGEQLVEQVGRRVDLDGPVDELHAVPLRSPALAVQRLGGGLEGVEVVAPELVEERAQRWRDARGRPGRGGGWRRPGRGRVRRRAGP